MGRPSKYQPEFCEQLRESMAKGFSFEASCGLLGVSKDTGYEWTKRFPEFAEAKAVGNAQGQAWWEQEAINGRFSDQWSKFNATVWVFTMKNQYGWRDKREHSGSIGVGLDNLYADLTPAQIEAKIGDLLARLPKPKPPSPSLPSKPKPGKGEKP